MSLRALQLTEIRRLLRSADDLELSAGAVQRLKWFLYAREHEDNVSLTCRHFGIGRSTFLRWAERFDPQDLRTIEEQSRRPKHVRTSVVPDAAIHAIRRIRLQQPLLSKNDVAECLMREEGIQLSPSTVGRIIQRYGFFFAATKAHQEKRLHLDDERNMTAVKKDHDITMTSAPLVQNDELPSDDASGAFSVLGFTA